MRQRIVVYGLLRRFTPRNDKGNKRQYPPHRHCDYETVIARLCRRSENLVIETTTHNPHCHCEGQNSSLREPKVRGNLSMGYNYLFMGFFLFSVFILTFCGLWGFASLCKGGSCEATGGLRKN